jgi:hypothetical protein
MTKKAEDFDYVEIFVIDTTKSRAHFEMLESIEAFKTMNEQKPNNDESFFKEILKEAGRQPQYSPLFEFLKRVDNEDEAASNKNINKAMRKAIKKGFKKARKKINKKLNQTNTQ